MVLERSLGGLGLVGNSGFVLVVRVVWMVMLFWVVMVLRVVCG